MSNRIDRALSLIKTMPRVMMSNIIEPFGSKHNKKVRRRSSGRTHGRGHKGQGQRMTLPRLGFEGGNTPFYMKIPSEPYYKGHHVRRQYLPLSLLQLQRMIDLGRVNREEPIDLTQICNTKLLEVDVIRKQYGINLTEEGADIFDARVNIEVQWTNEVVIAAIERLGGTITTRYYDPQSLFAVVNPLQFFRKSLPIPRCMLPPHDAMEYYSDAKFRGYLADPDKIHQARIELAQKYGYDLPDMTDEPLYKMLLQRKDPRQIFYGLEPGWVVNLYDKSIIKPTDPEYVEYYRS